MNKIQSYLKIGVFLKALLHLFYPHICLQCGTDELGEYQVLCDNCESQLPYTHFTQIQHSPVEKIFWGRVQISSVVSVLFFTKESIVQKIIFELKYKQNKKAGYLLGRLIAYELINAGKYNAVDYLVPIPISKRKLRTRGFNQSQIICEAIIANGFNVPIFNGLTKSKHSDTQTHKDRMQRGAQSENLFSLAHVKVITNKRLLLIDDVLTTGSTIEAACICLLEAKPLTIQLATAAYTL